MKATQLQVQKLYPKLEPYKNHTHTAYLWHFYRPCAPISLGAWSSVLSGNWGSPLWWSWSRPQRNPAPWPALKQQHTHQKENTCLEKVKKTIKMLSFAAHRVGLGADVATHKSLLSALTMRLCDLSSIMWQVLCYSAADRIKSKVL